MIKVIKVKTNFSLINFSKLLTINAINHKISEESGELVIWTDVHSNVEKIKQLYSAWQKRANYSSRKPKNIINFNLLNFIYKLPWKQQKISYLITILTLIVWLFFIVNPHRTIIWLMFADLNLIHSSISEPWRLITPIFLHFNLMHLLFNIATFLILATRIEYKHGGLILFITLIISGIFSNWLQFILVDTILFGGLSGVVYALVGYCAVFQLLNKRMSFGIPPAYFVIMFIWLLLGYTNFTVLIGIGKIANHAHSGGLACGAIIATIVFLLKNLK